MQRRRDFEYFAPRTLEDALDLLLEHREDDTKVICGGQSLLILMKQGVVAPDYLVDIKGLSSLNYVDNGRDWLRIGAGTPHRAIETSIAIADWCPVLCEAERRLADVEVRNWGTIGGNLAHADPSGDIAPCLIVLDGRLKLQSANGERILPIDQFSVDFFETVLRPDELLTEIQIPKVKPYTGSAYTKFVIVEGDHPIVGAAVSVTLDPATGSCRDARVALTGAGPVPLRARRTEKVLAGNTITEDVIAEAADVASNEADPVSDMHASEAYKRMLVGILVRDVTKAALQRVNEE